MIPRELASCVLWPPFRLVCTLVASFWPKAWRQLWEHLGARSATFCLRGMETKLDLVTESNNLFPMWHSKLCEAQVWRLRHGRGRHLVRTTQLLLAHSVQVFSYSTHIRHPLLRQGFHSGRRDRFQHWEGTQGFQSRQHPQPPRVLGPALLHQPGAGSFLFLFFSFFSSLLFFLFPFN